MGLSWAHSRSRRQPGIRHLKVISILVDWDTCAWMSAPSMLKSNRMVQTG